MISVVSCRKGGEPIPVFNEVEIISDEDATPAIKKVKPNDKGGNKGDDVVGGDDNEDDDGGVVGGVDGNDLDFPGLDPNAG